MLRNRWISTTLFCAALFSTAIFTGCAAHVSAGYRVYDPAYRDYHTWGPDEDVYYHRWLGERHYEYRDFRHLDKGRQRDYWQWRHGQH